MSNFIFEPTFNGFISYNGVMICQNEQELKWLISEVEKIKPKVVVEIGMERGGSMSIWKEICGDNSLLIGVDLTDSAIDKSIVFGDNVKVVLGSSQDKSTIEIVTEILDGKQVDFLFIDGDHDAKAIALDYKNYSTFVRPGGIIGFHDINCSPEVKHFWRMLSGEKSDMSISIGTGIVRK